MRTLRLELRPLTVTTGRAVLAGDFCCLETAEGWPHEDTLDGIRMAVGPGPKSLVWLVTLEGVVIGDCGTVGPLRAGGEIEIGYGLAAEHRGRGYGTEVVAALSGWLRSRPGVNRVVAEVLAGNVPSRRALERAGFELERSEGDRMWYSLASKEAVTRRPSRPESRRLTRLQAR
jgi:RimJ/RimL family protein N-acetyltransferase